MEATAPSDQKKPSWAGRLQRWLAHSESHDVVPLLAAVLIGVGAGFGAIFFRYLIEGVTHLAFDRGGEILEGLGAYYVLVIPALGGLIIGPLLYYLAPEAKGHGVPEVMHAVALKGGRIRPIVAPIKALASSICIGTGGSVGREGPIVQIGSTLGSSLGQLMKMSSNGIRLMVACGAAGAISATFNAPVGGVIFSLEVILGEFAVGHFSTVVVASVTASVIARVFIGDVTAFQVPEHALASPWELPLYALLGVLAAAVGTLFTKLLYWSEDFFDSWKLKGYLKPAVGGLGVGVLGFFYPQIFGVGYGAMEEVLANKMLLGTALALLGAKLAATALTLGSGGSGGVFAPSLFLGAMLGGSFGALAHRWLPGVTAHAGAYALVGMAAVFAASARAPITAIIILFEMTGDYRIILPLMLSSVLATLVARRMEPESVYTLKLARRGIRLQRGRDVDVMRGVKVGEVMFKDVPTVLASTTLEELGRHFQSYGQRGCPVLDERGELFGIVSIQDLSRALSEEDEDRKVGDICTREVITTTPEETMWDALMKMAPRDLSSLPVVEPDRPSRVLGVIRRRDIVRAYNLTIARRSRIERLVSERVEVGGDVEFCELEVSGQSPAIGRSLADLDLPRRCVIVSIRRAGRVLIPRGDSVIEAGDRITAFLGRGDKTLLEQTFAPGSGISGRAFPGGRAGGRPVRRAWPAHSWRRW